MGKGGAGKGQHAFKVLCPEELAGALMGHNGKGIKAIEEETGAKLLMSQRDEHFPGSRLRILTIFHESSGGVFDALVPIVDRIVECGDRERAAAPKGEPDFIGKELGSFVCRVAVSQRMAGAIIGTKGQKIKQLKEEAQAQITINMSIQMDHQECKVIAAPDGIVRALRRLNEDVQKDSGEGAFKSWAHATFPRGEESERPPRERPPHREREQPVREVERERERSPWREPHDQAFEGDAPKDSFRENIDASLGIIDQACGEFPPGSLDEDYIITCEMTKDKVPAMIGKHGAYVKEVCKSTKTQIRFKEAEEEVETQTLVIQGKIVDTYRAHVLMMKRYHECDEEQRSTERPHVADLQKQVEELQKQLEATKQAKLQSKGKEKEGKGKEKGKAKHKFSKGKGKA